MVTLMVTMAVVTMMAITDSGEGEDILLEDSVTHQASNGDVVMITRDFIGPFYIELKWQILPPLSPTPL